MAVARSVAQASFVQRAFAPVLQAKSSVVGNVWTLNPATPIVGVVAKSATVEPVPKECVLVPQEKPCAQVPALTCNPVPPIAERVELNAPVVPLAKLESVNAL